MSSINLKDYFKNPHVNFNNVEINENKPPIELLLPSFILYLANKPENATKTQLIYHLDSHTFSGSKIKNQNIFTSNFEENPLFFDIGDEKTIEINSTFQTKDLDNLVKVINSDIQIKEEYNPEQKKQLYHIINCKRLLYALTEYEKIRSSDKDEKDEENEENESNLEKTLESSLTNPSNENPSDQLPSNENPSNKNPTNKSLQNSLKNSLKKGLEENLTIQNLYNILEKSLTVRIESSTTHSINDDSNKILLLNTLNSPNFKNMKQFFTLIVDTNFSSNAEALKNRYLVNEDNILSFYNIIYNLEIVPENSMQLTLNTIEQINDNISHQISMQKIGGSLINELDYQLHTTMYILKMIKLLVYRHVFFKQYELVNKDYLIEVFVNICLFFIFTNGNIDHMVCYIIDQIAIMVAILTYIHVCEKESWAIDVNIISGIILSPVYLVVC
jgi:hypothetical protein